MFDLAWSEIALIGVVALVVIGPKDLPEAIRGLARGVQKLRRMAGEFQNQADELVREANLDEVRNSINDIRNFNIRDTLEKHVDKDGTIRKTFTEDPLKADYGSTATTPAAPVDTAAEPAPPPPAAPAFIPPAFVPTPPVPTPPVVAAAPPPPPPPAFVPPTELPETLPPAPEPAPTHKT